MIYGLIGLDALIEFWTLLFSGHEDRITATLREEANRYFKEHRAGNLPVWQDSE